MDIKYKISRVRLKNEIVETEAIEVTLNCGIEYILRKNTTYKTSWYLTCNELNISMKDLETDNCDMAKENAKEYVIEKLMLLRMRYFKGIQELS